MTPLLRLETPVPRLVSASSTQTFALDGPASGVSLSADGATAYLTAALGAGMDLVRAVERPALLAFAERDREAGAAVAAALVELGPGVVTATGRGGEDLPARIRDGEFGLVIVTAGPRAEPVDDRALRQAALAAGVPLREVPGGFRRLIASPVPIRILRVCCATSVR